MSSNYLDDFTNAWVDGLQRQSEKVELKPNLSMKHYTVHSKFDFEGKPLHVMLDIYRTIPFSTFIDNKDGVDLQTEVSIWWSIMNEDEIETTTKEPTEIHPTFDPSKEVDILKLKTVFNNYEYEGLRVYSFLNSVKLIDLIAGSDKND